MTFTVAAVLASSLLVGAGAASSLAASQPAGTAERGMGSATGQPGHPQPRQGPYDKLFQQPALLQRAAAEPPQVRPPVRPDPPRNNRRIVCGLTIIEADPTLDPKIRIGPKDAADSKIRALTPPACTE